MAENSATRPLASVSAKGDAQAPDRFVPILDPDHPMRRTAAGDLLYWRLTRLRRRSTKTDAAPG
jgi:hypothetical protein